MRILVVRTGSTWFGPLAVSEQKRGTLTSQGNHDAIVRALVKYGGHEVMCVGKIEGDLSLGRDVSQASWAVRPGDQLDVLHDLFETVEAWRPDAWLECCGASPTNVDPHNERGSIVQAATWRYWWPAFELNKRLRLPRICVVTDCRCYPREQEINAYPSQLPVAVLSQENAVISKRILDCHYTIHARYAGIERYRLDGIKPMPIIDGAPYVTAIAHGHESDKRISRGRVETWSKIGRAKSPIHVYGSGWQWLELEPDLAPKLILHGPVPHQDIWGALNKSSCGPLVPMQHGWMSPKYGEYALAGCLPLPHGKFPSATLTYDAGECCVPIECDTRFSTTEELDELTRRAASDHAWRRDRIEQARNRIHLGQELGTLLGCVEYFGTIDSHDSRDPRYASYGGYQLNG